MSTTKYAYSILSDTQVKNLFAFHFDFNLLFYILLKKGNSGR